MPYVLTSINHSAYEGGTYPGLNGGADRILFEYFYLHPVFSPIPSSAHHAKTANAGFTDCVRCRTLGEEIYVDKYGRVKVQFHWDRRGTNNENSSCWIRVSHLWAGKGWGAIFTPASARKSSSISSKATRTSRSSQAAFTMQRRLFHIRCRMSRREHVASTDQELQL